jgi:pimeloyl-ACP methyl ester carboxylesterase
VIRRFFVGRNAPGALVAAVRSAIAKTPRRVLADRMRAVLTLPPAELQARVDVPVLALRGTDDAMVVADRWSLDRLASSVTRTDLAGPHLLFQTAPVEAWATIMKFLREIDRSQ